jgi:phospholipid/cholesterol/gamma-HCH transport system substrate-binding protein
MNFDRKYAVVGLFVILASVGFVAGAWWLSGRSPGGADLYVLYSEVSTLKDASPVRISGAPVGRVDGIHYLAPGKVIVGLKFNGHDGKLVHPTSTAVASITAVGMLGDMMIDLNPGTGTPLAKGDTIAGKLTTGLFDKAAQIADQAGQVMGRLNKMLDTQLVLDLRKTLSSTQHLMAMLSDPKNGPTAQLAPTMVALQAAAARFDSTMAQLDPKALQTHLDSTMTSASHAADRVAALSARADSLIGQMQHSQGTLGRLVNDTTLYVQFNQTAAALTRLLNEIAKNPGKIGVTVRIP